MHASDGGVGGSDCHGEFGSLPSRSPPLPLFTLSVNLTTHWSVPSLSMIWFCIAFVSSFLYLKMSHEACLFLAGSPADKNCVDGPLDLLDCYGEFKCPLPFNFVMVIVTLCFSVKRQFASEDKTMSDSETLFVVSDSWTM